jgi:hypothetical protein
VDVCVVWMSTRDHHLRVSDDVGLCVCMCVCVYVCMCVCVYVCVCVYKCSRRWDAVRSPVPLAAFGLSLALPAAPPAPMPPTFLDAVNTVLTAGIARLQRAIAFRVVYGEWRVLLVHQLYVPSPGAAGGLLLQDALPTLEHGMNVLFELLPAGDAVAPDMARIVWSTLVGAIQWVLLYGMGLRSLYSSDAPLLAQDIRPLRDLFAKELGAEQVQSLSGVLDDLIAAIRDPTDALIARYERPHGSRLSPAHLLMIMWQRSGKDKAARKFVRAVRATMGAR